ncbi:hypothetical protein [Saccharibacillus sp. JS10]|uniref:hypothetical protein n=1 Tax=Saccharibacillus sp. JS10 TaxID=2950552 RepID=UPI00210C4A51|nr:hypothetical protein [Saccharibacillus sp. JS10]MCQ4086815.1 hypothetical protein [Saccharibacillus sp. JS10]
MEGTQSGGTIPDEVIKSEQTPEQWKRRRIELAKWAEREKVRRSPKQIGWLNGVEVDAELVKTLRILNRLGIQTEFSCAGVSPLDEPEEHSLYAYVTLVDSPLSEAFVMHAIQKMKHRLLVSYEPSIQRYDLSSFMVGQNRSFCLLLEVCAKTFEAQQR